MFRRRKHTCSNFEFLRQRFNGLADVLEAFAEVFAPVPGNQHKLLAALHDGFGQLCDCGRFFLYFFERQKQGVYDGVAGDKYSFGCDAFLKKVLSGLLCGREMQGAEVRGQNAVCLFRKRRVFVACAQAGFDMADGYFVVEGAQGGTEDGCGVALDDDDVGLFFCEIGVDGADGSGG